MTTNSPRVLPKHHIEQLKGMRRMLRLIASHATHLGPLTPPQVRIVRNIRMREALSTFLDYLFSQRTAEELQKLPYDRDLNYGMSLWRDNAKPIADPLIEHAVVSKKKHETEMQVMLARLAAARAAPGTDPHLLLTTKPFCTEHQALQLFMDSHDPSKGKVEGTLTLYTERFPCKVCCGVITQFISKQPGVYLAVFYQYDYFREEDNRTGITLMQQHPNNLTLRALKYRPHR